MSWPSGENAVHQSLPSLDCEKSWPSVDLAESLGSDIPQPDRPVVGARRQCAVVRRESNALERLV